MVSVVMTSHLYQFFPTLRNRELQLAAGTVAELLQRIDDLAPGFIDYIVDERGRLRQHVNIGINQNLIVDRTTLADYVAEGSSLFIFQALTGG